MRVDFERVGFGEQSVASFQSHEAVLVIVKYEFTPVERFG